MIVKCPKRQKRACSACGRLVAMRNLSSSKARVPHLCPHGVACIAGQRYANEGWNPGGSRHETACPTCAKIATARRVEVPNE